LIASNDGVYPRYQAVGDDGDIPEFNSEKVSVNIGFGLCMLPSEPRLRRGDEMPYPGVRELVFSDTISPNNGFRGARVEDGFKFVNDCEAWELVVTDCRLGPPG
jgi:hypothetical protein